MNVGRVGFDAVVLGDGSVLAVGDDYACNPGPAASGSERAEVYEPADDRWIEVESLNKPRKLPATIALQDGSAMVIGGINAEDVSFSSTKIFSPTTRTWTDGPLLDVARGQPLAATLEDGRVLVASEAAVDETSSITTTEIYDPSVGTWSRAATLNGPHLLGLLPLADGRVLGFGTEFEVSVWLEIFDPKRDTWTSIEPPEFTHWNLEYVALNDGGILAVGGWVNTEVDRLPADLVERYDPRQNRWSEVPMTTPRVDATAVRLADGRVLVAGGYVGDGFANSQAVASVELFDPASGRWTTMPDLLEARYDATAVVLGDGSVLLMGGYANFNVDGDTPWCGEPMISVERFTPPSS
jgi:hypothetical protein